LRSISPFGTRTAAPEPTTQLPAVESPPKPRDPEVAERSNDGPADSQPNPKLTDKHSEQAEGVIKQDGHQAVMLGDTEGKSNAVAHDVSPATSSQATQEGAQSEEDAKLQIRRMVLTRTSKYNPTIDRRIRRKAKLASGQNSEVLGKDKTVESRSVSSAKENHSHPEDMAQEAMKQQLHQLSKQVEALKEALERKTSGDEADLQKRTPGKKTSKAKLDAVERTPERSTLGTPSTSNPSKRARATWNQQHAAHVQSEPAELHQQPTQGSKTGPVEAPTKGIAPRQSYATPVIVRANAHFRKHISEMINVAHSLRRTDAKLSKPMIAMVERRLVDIGQDARRKGDAFTLSTLQKYVGWDQLAAVSSIPPMSRLTPSTSTKNRHGTTSTALTSAHRDQRTHASLVRRVELETHKDVKAARKHSATPSELEGTPVTSGPLHSGPKNQDNVAKAGTAESKLKSTEDNAQPARNQQPASVVDNSVLSQQTDTQQLVRQIHKQSHAMRSSSQLQHSALWVPAEKLSLHEPTKASIPETKTQSQNLADHTVVTHAGDPPVPSNELNDQSLLDELFPEASVAPPVRTVEKHEQYPKLDLPEPARLIRPEFRNRPKTLKEQAIEAFTKRGETVTALQLEHCSTELTEPDFRRLIPKGDHVDAWNPFGAYYKIIPGRDPLSLERLPFYYILFKSPESAHAYQRNAGRLHKLAALHQPSSIFSAIPAPKGFLENGEDIDAVTSSYLLRPTEHAFTLRMLMQPYHPALRTLFEQGGYKPIVSSDDKKNTTHKVLMHIEGYEPSLSDLFLTLKHDAYNRGIPFTLRNESSSSIHRLRDLINLKTHTLPMTSNPRAFEGRKSNEPKVEFEDPSIEFFMKSEAPADEDHAKVINQVVMNRVYNRWIIDFDDEDEARRFAISWHRRVLPDFALGQRTWKDYEEVRMCNTELLW
jgi:hypothetical protein